MQCYAVLYANLSIKMAWLIHKVCCGFSHGFPLSARLFLVFRLGWGVSIQPGIFICWQAPRGYGISTLGSPLSNLLLYQSGYTYTSP